MTEPSIVAYLRRTMAELAGDRTELRTLIAAEHVAQVVQLFAVTTPQERHDVFVWLKGQR